MLSPGGRRGEDASDRIVRSVLKKMHTGGNEQFKLAVSEVGYCPSLLSNKLKK